MRSEAEETQVQLDHCESDCNSLIENIARLAVENSKLLAACIEARNMLGSVMAFLPNDAVNTRQHCAKAYADLCTILKEPSR